MPTRATCAARSRWPKRGRGRTAPNPVVGAVIAAAGRVVGEGWHRAVGKPHAEVEALAAAGRRARGATLYVTLEPCAHWGRTPPCVDAVIAAGITRCVVALRDPDARVNGRGLRRMRAAGIEVVTGVLAAEARAQLAGYTRAHVHGLPRITWKVAATLDGRVADARGRSRWITGTAARCRGASTSRGERCDRDRHRHRARRRSASHRASRRARQRPAARGRGFAAATAAHAAAVPPALARGTVVACAKDAPAARERALVARGVTVWRLPTLRGRVSPRALAERLAKEGRHEVMLEGGPTLGSAFLAAELVQRIVMYGAPLVLGGGRNWCDGLDLALATTSRGRIAQVARVGDDVRLTVEWED
jgi:diaminohydroxyphosphoribosylaminopyrimidine deaminase/5-amino-6-(5-phosphoribosylamino)uracil reductase